jgi:hypothetical protein
MGGSHKRKISNLSGNDRSPFWSAPPARTEAGSLFQLIRSGVTLEAIRELIAIPPATVQVLRMYVSEHPEERQAIERALAFRQRVGEEFERLVCVGQGSEPQELVEMVRKE